MAISILSPHLINLCPPAAALDLVCLFRVIYRVKSCFLTPFCVISVLQPKMASAPALYHTGIGLVCLCAAGSMQVEPFNPPDSPLLVY